MIDPKSLRIGNKLFNDKKEVITVRGIEMPDGYVYEEGYDRPLYEGQYQPIPLSEQELIRLGCTQISNLYNVWNTPNGITFNFQEEPHPCGLITFSARHVHFYDVHTFQNIIALTGTELTYKVDSGLTPTEPVVGSNGIINGDYKEDPGK